MDLKNIKNLSTDNLMQFYMKAELLIKEFNTNDTEIIDAHTAIKKELGKRVNIKK
jgi:hypothetical protein